MRRCNELVSQNWCSEVWRVVGNDSRYSILSPYVIYLPLHNRCCCLCRSPLGRRVCRCCRCLLTERFPSQHVVVSWVMSWRREVGSYCSHQHNMMCCILLHHNIGNDYLHQNMQIHFKAPLMIQHVCNSFCCEPVHDINRISTQHSRIATTAVSTFLERDPNSTMRSIHFVHAAVSTSQRQGHRTICASELFMRWEWRGAHGA